MGCWVKRLKTGALLALLAAPTARSQSFTVRDTIIDPSPPTGPLEKVIDYFTSTSYPSIFLGTNQGAVLYDTQSGRQITIAATGTHYESAMPFYYPGDRYPGVIASVDNSLVWYQNPANWNGGDATQGWGKYVISPHGGCHDLGLADLDGDGKEDVACSGTGLYGNASFVIFQNAWNNWSAPRVNATPAGEGIALVAINGVDGGVRNNIIGCNDDKLYWYENPGGTAARTVTWSAHYIGPCSSGASLASLDVGDRDIVIAASNEDEWASGLVYYDPGSNPFAAWTQHTIDSSYRSVHQITPATVGDVRYIAVGEQEQASNACNRPDYNEHPEIAGCRVAIFPWTGNGFGAPTLVSNLGTHNQDIIQIGDTAWMVGSNHDSFHAVDPALHLWQFTE